MKKKVVRLNFYGVRLPGVIGIASTRTTGDWPADARAPTRTTGEWQPATRAPTCTAPCKGRHSHRSHRHQRDNVGRHEQDQPRQQ